jgi:type 1 fimbria pilin
MKLIFTATCMVFFLYSSQTFAFRICSAVRSSVSLSDTIIVQRDLAVNAPLKSQESVSPSMSLYTCPAGSANYQELIIKTTMPYTGQMHTTGRLYTTSYSGLAIKIGADANSNGVWIGKNLVSGSGSANPNQSVIVSTASFYPSISATATMLFFKTGKLTSGTYSQQIAAYFLGSDLGSGGWSKPIPIIMNLNLVVLSCSLTTPTMAAPLGNVYSTAFTGVGSTTGNVDFNLGLNCAAGTKINVTMNGTQNTDTANTSVLALTGAGSAGVAKGVGAQILYNNRPLNIGTRLLLKTAAGGIETFPFKARYYQTLNNVLPGSANATATLSITYL